MVSLLFRKYTFSMQMRQLSTAFIRSKNKVQTNVVYHWTDTKRTNCVNYNVTAHRPFNSASDDRQCLEPLMDVPRCYEPGFFTSWKVLINAAIVRFTVDDGFNLFSYMEGTTHAIVVISQALATQNYDALEGLVETRTLETLKRNVSSLTQSQRDLIFINKECIVLHVPIDVQIKSNKNTDDSETVLEISNLIYYTDKLPKEPNNENNIQQFLEDLTVLKGIVICNYTFQRKYKNRVGDSWIATVVNHFSPNQNTN